MSRGPALPRRRMLQAGGAGLLAGAIGVRPAMADAVSLTVGTFSGAGNDVVTQVVSPAFAKDHPGIDVRLVARAAAEAYPKLLIARSNPPENAGMWNDTFAALGANAGLFEKIDPANAPESGHVPAALQPRHGFGLACAVQPYGIAYNPDHVEKPKSWLDLFNPKYVGKVAMHENYWDQYIMLARILGHDEHDLTPAIDEWAKHKQNIGAWTNSYTRLEELVDKGEMWLGPQWGGFTVAAQRRGLKIAFAWPDEGCTQQTILACVNKVSSPEVTKAAEQFVDYWLKPDFQLALLKNLGLSPTNSQVAVPADYASVEGIIVPGKPTKPLFQYDFAYVGSNLQKIRREIDTKLR